MKKPRVGTTYIYQPVGMDLWDSRTELKPGDRVVVVNLPGCPPAGTKGHCHVEKDGQFAGLVLCNSLQPLPAWEGVYKRSNKP